MQYFRKITEENVGACHGLRDILRKDLHVKFIKEYFYNCGRKARKQTGETEKNCDINTAKASANPERNLKGDMTLESFLKLEQV